MLQMSIQKSCWKIKAILGFVVIYHQLGSLTFHTSLLILDWHLDWPFRDSSQPHNSLYKSLDNCVWWQFSSAEVWIRPHLYTHPVSSQVLLCLRCQVLNDPQWIWKETTHPIMWDFYQTAIEPQSVEHSFSHSFTNPLWFQLELVMTGPGHMKLHALLSHWSWRLSETESLPCGMQIRLHVFEIWEQW